MTRRPALTRTRVVEAAAAVADAGGLAAVSMRTVGKALGVEAMSLYHHVAGKEELLNAMADWVFGQITAPAPELPWAIAMAERARVQRAVLLRHPWGLGFLESRRQPGLASIAHHDAVLGCLRRQGFGIRLAAHAFSVLDAYVFGFVLSESHLPFDTADGAQEMVSDLSLDPAQFPHLAELVQELVLGKEYTYGTEFEYGLRLVLDGLGRDLEDQAAAG